MPPKRVAAKSVVEILKKAAKREKSDAGVHSDDVIIISSDDDDDDAQSVFDTAQQTSAASSSIVSASAALSSFPVQHSVTTPGVSPACSHLYDELVDLLFPPPSMREERRLQLMKTPSINNTRPVKEVHRGQSGCTLNLKTCAQGRRRHCAANGIAVALFLKKSGVICSMCYRRKQSAMLFHCFIDFPRTHAIIEKMFIG